MPSIEVSTVQKCWSGFVRTSLPDSGRADSSLPQKPASQANAIQRLRRGFAFNTAVFHAHREPFTSRQSCSSAFSSPQPEMRWRPFEQNASEETTLRRDSRGSFTRRVSMILFSTPSASTTCTWVHPGPTGTRPICI